MYSQAGLKTHSQKCTMGLVSPMGIVMVVVSFSTWFTGLPQARGQDACEEHCTVCGTTYPNDVCEGQSIYYQVESPPSDPLIPLIDLSDPSYRFENDYPMGLSIDDRSNLTVQQNTLPDGHRNAGLKEGNSIVPRSGTGGLDCPNGLVGVLSIGFSNVRYEFQTFLEEHIEPLTPGNLNGLNPRLVFVNGAKNNTDLCAWQDVLADNTNNPWGNILHGTLGRLNEGRQPGHGADNIVVTAEQIQVIWVKLPHSRPAAYCNNNPNGCDCDPDDCCGQGLCGDPGCRFPNWVFGTDGEVEKFKVVLQHMKEEFENLLQVYISSRIYGGWANEVHDGGSSQPTVCGSGNPEPYAYVNGITVQELTRLQIYGSPPNDLPFAAMDPFPYIQWGPYLWANGTLPNPYPNLIGLGMSRALRRRCPCQPGRGRRV